jgi:P4 family phage/plasmid primase-like protien
LKNILSIELSLQYTQLGLSYKRKLIDATDESKKKEIDNRIKQCECMRNKVKTTRFKANVIEECKTKFYNKEFDEMIYSRTYLICFDNGVYDLNKRRFRDGRPDDYISFTTGIDYVTYDAENQHVKSVFEFIGKVFVDTDVRKYVLTLFASFFHGDMEHQHFHIWTGCGSNGKSTIIDFYENTLGDYSTPLPTSLLTKPRGNSGAASPELRVTRGKRFAHMQEPENNDHIYVGHMKEITGGDSIQCRGLYESPITFRPQFSLVLCCNDLPTISATDGGTWRRLRVVRFRSRFVDNPNPGSIYEFKKDAKIMKNIHKKEWREAFASILIHTYGEYRDNGLVTPESVIEHCKEYQKQSNMFLEFIDEYIVRIEKPGKKMLITGIYETFKAWHTVAIGGKTPSRNEVKNEFEKVFGPMHRTHGWNNIMFRDED